MIHTFFLALGLVLVLITAMSIGVIFGRKPISGSCGGVGSQVGGGCSVCGRDSGSCEDDEGPVPGSENSDSAKLAYSAGQSWAE